MCIILLQKPLVNITEIIILQCLIKEQERKEHAPNLGKEKRASVTRWGMNVEWIITVEKLKNAASVVASECA